MFLCSIITFITKIVYLKHYLEYLECDNLKGIYDQYIKVGVINVRSQCRYYIYEHQNS